MNTWFPSCWSLTASAPQSRTFAVGMCDETQRLPRYAYARAYVGTYEDSYGGSYDEPYGRYLQRLRKSCGRHMESCTSSATTPPMALAGPRP